MCARTASLRRIFRPGRRDDRRHSSRCLSVAVPSPQSGPAAAQPEGLVVSGGSQPCAEAPPKDTEKAAYRRRMERHSGRPSDRSRRRSGTAIVGRSTSTASLSGAASDAGARSAMSVPARGRSLLSRHRQNARHLTRFGCQVGDTCAHAFDQCRAGVGE
jgi:hypothetical protein